jgi:hypothetical protein
MLLALSPPRWSHAAGGRQGAVPIDVGGDIRSSALERLYPWRPDGVTETLDGTRVCR